MPPPTNCCLLRLLYWWCYKTEDEQTDSKYTYAPKGSGLTEHHDGHTILFEGIILRYDGESHMIFWSILQAQGLGIRTDFTYAVEIYSAGTINLPAYLDTCINQQKATRGSDENVGVILCSINRAWDVDGCDHRNKKDE